MEGASLKIGKILSPQSSFNELLFVQGKHYINNVYFSERACDNKDGIFV